MNKTKKKIDKKTKKEISKVDPSIEREKFLNWINEKILYITSYMVCDIAHINVVIKNEDSSCRDGNYIFVIRYSQPYRRATVFVFDTALKMFKEGALKELQTALAHELCHIHTAPLSDLAFKRLTTKDNINDAAEALTEIMSYYLRKVIDPSTQKIIINNQ